MAKDKSKAAPVSAIAQFKIDLNQILGAEQRKKRAEAMYQKRLIDAKSTLDRALKTVDDDTAALKTELQNNWPDKFKGKKVKIKNHVVQIKNGQLTVGEDDTVNL